MGEKKYRKVELLSPGGSMDGIRAAVNAGADAVYAGGRLFGARAYADNPDESGMEDAIDYCHLHQTRFYLTVNTLLKEEELEERLYDYIAPLYERGIDAVLVQDFGVFRFLRRSFPELPLHASTQMTVTGADGAVLLSRMGAERVVLSRELSLDEIREIRRRTDAELETFVHGALCFCYSGQCLMSSMIGGRSGNRGRCAQPCRLPWTFEEECGDRDEKRGRLPEGGRKAAGSYLMSLKDICTLDLLPDLIDAGISSLKIEGRMKRPEYAAGVTAVYRKYIDSYLSRGRTGYQVEEEDRRLLLDLFNRGGFSEGYYRTRNGPSMMASDRPNHCGTAAGTVKDAGQGRILIQAAEDLYAGDLLQVGTEQFCLRADVQKGKTAVLETAGGLKTAGGPKTAEGLKAAADLYSQRHRGRARRGGDREEAKAQGESSGRLRGRMPAGQAGIRAGDMVLRVRAQHLLDQLKQQYVDPVLRLEADVRAEFHAGRPAAMTAVFHSPSGLVFEASETGAAVQRAQRCPLSEEDLRRQLEKTGDSVFRIRTLEIEADRDVFLPVSMLNRLRRETLLALRSKILEGYRRRLPGAGRGEIPVRARAVPCEGVPEGVGHASASHPAVTASVMRWDQLEEVLKADGIGGVYLDSSMLIESYERDRLRRKDLSWAEDLQELTDRIRSTGKKAYLSLPVIWRADTAGTFERYFSPDLLERFDGILAESYDQLEAAARWGIAGSGAEIIADAGLYTWNHEAGEMLRQLGVTMDTLPYECTAAELKKRCCTGSEIVIYGRVPLMIAAQCQVKNHSGCRHQPGWGKLTDRKNIAFPVKNDCTYCTNRIFNSAVLDLRVCEEDVRRLGAASQRYSFTCESGRQTGEILRGTSLPADAAVPQTRGHFRKGVE